MSVSSRYGKRNLQIWEHHESILKEVADLLKEGNNLLWKDDFKAILQSASSSYQREFKEMLCKFLEGEYNEPVQRDTITMNYGATSGLTMIIRVLFGSKTVAFVEEITYTQCREILEEHGCTLVPVKFTVDGIDTEDFERLLQIHCMSKVTDKSICYNGLAYLIPTVHNPTGMVYSEDCCKRIIQLARKYNILVVCDDVYTTMLYIDGPKPRRLFSYDKRNDKDYGIGHVVSNGTFSKIVSPSIRFGWLEAPVFIVQILEQRFGPIAQSWQVLFTALWKNDLFMPYLKKVKTFYKERMRKVCQRLNEGLPDEFLVKEPEGGFFVWLQVPGIDANELLQVCSEKYGILFWPGPYFSTIGGHNDCLRLSISTPNEDELLEMIDNLTKTIREMS